MKKLSTLLFLVLLTRFASADVFVVTVSNFSFNPATTACNVGDTVIFVWGSGGHTTTSTNIPTNAISWDAPIDASNTQFLYQVLEAGTYTYDCSFHPNMIGTLEVSGSSGINVSTSLFNSFHVNASANGNSINVAYSINKMSPVQLKMLDLTGKLIKDVSLPAQPAGMYNETYYTDELQKGIYIVELTAAGQRFTRRVVLH